MNRGSLPEMLHCTDMTVLERQRARLKWQQDQLQHQPQQQQEEESYFSELSGVFSGLSQASQVQSFQGGFVGGHESVLSDVVTRSVKPDPCLENGWSYMGKAVGVPGGMGFLGPCGYGNGSGFEMNYAISRTISCPPAVAAAVTAEAMEAKPRGSVLLEKISATTGKESFKKRKVDKILNTKVAAENDHSKNKKTKPCAEEGDSKITEQQNTNNTKTSSNKTSKQAISGDTSKDNSKVSDVQKPDYIHVRARRGQATDSHSLAERVRREKISERMKYLQDLVPGCNKITGKAGMLDEIINYVQSLQRQVEFLSMKLAAVNPRLEFDLENVFAKEAFPGGTGDFSAIGVSSEMTNPGYLQFNPGVSCSDMVINPPNDMGLRRTTSAPVSIPNTYLDPSCFPQFQTWDAPDLQNLYNNVAFDQGRSISIQAPPFAGSVEAGNLKMEI